jgi:excisionase family DNA binding protein
VFRTVEELAEALGISRHGAYVGLRNGTIPSIRMGKRYVVPREAIREWLRTAGSQPKEMR